MYKNKKTRRKISTKYKYKYKNKYKCGGNPPCSTPLEENEKCKWGATKRRCMRLAIDSTPKVGDEVQAHSTQSLPISKPIIMSDKEYPSVVDKIVAESPIPIYRFIPETAYPQTAKPCPPDIYMTDYTSRGIDTCIANPQTQWPCDCPPDWYHARIDGTFVCMNPLKLTPVYLKHTPDAPPEKIRVTIYDDKNHKKINRIATFEKITEKRDKHPEMDYIEYYEPTTARPEPEPKPKLEDAYDTEQDKDEDADKVSTTTNIFKMAKDRMKQKYANARKSVKNVMRPLSDAASKLKKNISKRASSISSMASMSLEKIAAAAVNKRDIASSKLRQEGLLNDRRKDMNLDETNDISEAIDKKMEPVNSWINKQTNKLGLVADKVGFAIGKKLNKLNIRTERCLYGKDDKLNDKPVLTDIIIKLAIEIQSQDADPSEYEKITRKVIDEYEDEHPYLYWTTVLHHRFYPYLMLHYIDEITAGVSADDDSDETSVWLKPIFPKPTTPPATTPSTPTSTPPATTPSTPTTDQEQSGGGSYTNLGPLGGLFGIFVIIPLLYLIVKSSYNLLKPMGRDIKRNMITLKDMAIEEIHNAKITFVKGKAMLKQGIIDTATGLQTIFRIGANNIKKLINASFDNTIKYIKTLPHKWQVLKKDSNDSITILVKKATGDIPFTITKELFLLGNDLVVSALNNDIQYLHLPFPSSSIEIITELPIKPYTIPRSLPRTARFNISADVEDMTRNCGIYEEFTEHGLKIIKASIPEDCYKGSKDPKCITVFNDTFINKIATSPENELCMDFWRLCIAYRIHFKYILNSKFTHEVADQLLKRRITALLVALTHYSSGETLDIERIGRSNMYRADSHV
jgi:hypothetical protein